MVDKGPTETLPDHGDWDGLQGHVLEYSGTVMQHTMSMATDCLIHSTYEASKSGITSRDAASAIVSFKATSTGIQYIGDIGYAQSTTSGTSLSITTSSCHGRR